MILVLSGEGPSDIGHCLNAACQCSDADFRIGPMTEVIDQVIETLLGYGPVSVAGTCMFVGETELKRLEHQRRGRSVSFVGKKRGRETAYFFINAWMLAELAIRLEAERRDEAIAVLFRDSDGTRSTSPASWELKWKSMEDGFQRAGFHRGVPMLPKPKSEAWLLGAARPTHANIARLETLPGNDAAAQNIKDLLAAELGRPMSAQDLCDWLREKRVDVERLAGMPSFGRFRDALVGAVGRLTQ